MVVIRIYTKKFIPQLKAWLDATNAIHRTVESHEGIYIVEIDEEYCKPKDLADLFEELAIAGNDAIKDSKPLMEAVKKNMSEYRSIITEQLGGHFEMYSEINAEGFIHFRMWEYSHIINMLLYAKVKKELEAYNIFKI